MLLVSSGRVCVSLVTSLFVSLFFLASGAAAAAVADGGGCGYVGGSVSSMSSCKR